MSEIHLHFDSEYIISILTRQYLPLICDDDNLKQSRHIEDTNEENSKGHVHLQEEEDEG